MPNPALPRPRVKASEHERRLRRTYLDALRRPLVGEVAITGAQRAATGTAVTLPAAVRARLVDGVLDVALPAGAYSLAASLRTVDGEVVTDREDVTL